MKIAFLSPQDVTGNAHTREWYTARSLEKLGHELVCICPQGDERNLLQKMLGRVLKSVGLRFHPERSPYVLSRVARRIESELAKDSFDLVFSLSSLYTAYLNVKIPMVTWTDAVFDCIVDFYDSHKKMDPLSRRWGHRAEERSLQRCALSILTSEWAALRARRRYTFGHDQLRVIPRGTYLPDVPSCSESLSTTKASGGGIFRALLIGTDWERKGGPLAYSTVSMLRDKGYSVQLTTVGMQVPERFQAPFVESIPFLRKDRAVDWAKLKEIMTNSDVLLLLSQADFTPNVISEAHAFALPVIATAVGAIPEMIEDRVTGYVVPPDSDASVYADRLERLILDAQRLGAMRIAARDNWERNFSQEVSSRRLSALLSYARYNLPPVSIDQEPKTL